MFRISPGSAGWMLRSLGSAAWLAATAVVACVHFLVTHACEGAQTPVLAYAAYLALHVWLPGIVVLAALHRGPVSITAAIALGGPTGFALEIASFLALSALDARQLAKLLPLAWAAAGAWVWRRSGGLVRWRVTARHAGVALALSAVYLTTAIAAVSNLYAEAPLVGGWPERPIFHDWVFLISRAAAIKHHWPLEDPSLAGTPLQYHYFMLVHAAAASNVTGLELSQLLLRLLPIPLGGMVVVQAFALGRMVSRRAWGGVLAALLTVAAGEMAFTPHMNESVFLGRFVRWLFVSPTFYFGLIFYGALLLVLARWREMPRMSAGHVAWLWLLAVVATGAKGTVIPALLPALVVWAGWRWWCSGAFPTRLAVAAACLGAGFWLAYRLMMAKWRSGGAGFAPLDIFGVSSFWKQQLPVWQEWLGGWLPATWSAPVASVALAAVVLAGTLGVRLLALGWLWRRPDATSRSAVEWLGAAALGSGAMGLLMKLDADGELYLFLLAQVPLAALAAGFAVRLVDEARARVGRRGEADTRRAGARVLAWTGIGGAVAMLAVQLSVWGRRHEPALDGWSQAVPAKAASPGMAELHEAMTWLRANTSRDAVVLANAFTPTNRKKDRWGAIDGTLAGVHYYYSALSERRVFVEGYLYLLDPDVVTRRMDIAEGVFFGERRPTPELFPDAPCFVLLDRSLGDGAKVALEPEARVFANARIEIFRVPDSRRTDDVPVVAAAP